MASKAPPNETAPDEECAHEQPEYDGRSNRSNICMDCEKACGGAGDRGCEWSRSFAAVPGWDAELVYLKQSPGNFVLTYHIRSCPKFVETPERPNSKTGLLSEAESYEFLKDPLGYLRRHDHGVNFQELAKIYGVNNKSVPTKKAAKKGQRRYVY